MMLLLMPPFKINGAISSLTATCMFDIGTSENGVYILQET